MTKRFVRGLSQADSSLTAVWAHATFPLRVPVQRPVRTKIGSNCYVISTDLYRRRRWRRVLRSCLSPKTSFIETKKHDAIPIPPSSRFCLRNAAVNTRLSASSIYLSRVLRHNSCIIYQAIMTETIIISKDWKNLHAKLLIKHNDLFSINLRLYEYKLFLFCILIKTIKQVQTLENK